MTVSIRPVRPDEMRDANQFLIDVGLTLPTDPTAIDAFWAGRGQDNPALKIHHDDVARGWVLEDDGKMVGFFGNLPLAGTHRGKPVRIACASAWGIHPDYRDHTEDMCRAYFEQPNVDLLMVTSAIKPTARRFEQFDGAPIPQPGLAEIPYWIVDAWGFLRAGFRKKGQGKTMAWVMGLLASVPLDFTMRMRGRRPYGSINHITPVKLNGIDDAFDDLWKRKQRELNDRVVATRDATALKWCFGLGSNNDETRLIRYDKDGVLLGYVAVVLETVSDIGLKRLKIADVLIEKDDPDIAKALFAAAYEYGIAKRCHVVEMIGLPPSLRRLIDKHKPFSRPMATQPFYCKVVNPKLADTAADPEGWYITAFDGDTVIL